MGHENPDVLPIGYAVRAYMAIVILAGIYSAFWLLEVAEISIKNSGGNLDCDHGDGYLVSGAVAFDAVLDAVGLEVTSATRGL